MCALALFILLLMPQFVGAVGEVKDAQFLAGTEDRGFEESNGAYRSLRLLIPIHVNFEGSYHVLASMRQSGIHTEVATQKETYKAGSYDLVVDLDGGVIYRSGVDGPYKIDLTLLTGSGEPVDTANYTTTVYSHEDFNTTKANANIPDIDITSDSVVLRFKDLTAEIYKTAPIIRYYYTEDKDSLSKSVLRISRIIAYDDNDFDGIPDQSEIAYTANLLNAFWEFNTHFDNIYEIKLNAELVLRDTTNFAQEGPHISVTFVYSAVQDPSGSYQLPVHMEIDCKAPLSQSQLDTKNICVESYLTDESGGRASEFDQAQQTGALVKKGHEQNYLKWEHAYSINDDVTGQSAGQCSLRSNASGGQRFFYATFNVTQYTDVIATTFNIGVRPGNYLGQEPPYQHNIWLYGLGIAVAVAIVLVTFKLQRRKAKKEVM